MTCVAADCSVLHLHEVILGNHAVATSHSHEDVSERGSLLHLHHLESIHYGLHSLDRIYLSHDNLSTKTFGTHCNTFTAPAVTCHHDILTGNNEVCCPIDSVPDRLTGTVTVVEQVLAVCIVHKHHRELECTSLIELNKAKNTCCGLLATADNLRNKVLIFSVHEIHEIATVIDDDVRSHLKHSSDVLLVLMSSCIIPCKHIQSRLHKSCCNVVLSRKRIASCNIHFGTTGCKNFTQVCSLRLKMHRKCDLKSLERKCSPELLLKTIEKWHMMFNPIYFQPAFLPKLRISNFACHIYTLYIIIQSARQR